MGWRENSRPSFDADDVVSLPMGFPHGFSPWFLHLSASPSNNNHPKQGLFTGELPRLIIPAGGVAWCLLFARAGDRQGMWTRTQGSGQRSLPRRLADVSRLKHRIASSARVSFPLTTTRKYDTESKPSVRPSRAGKVVPRVFPSLEGVISEPRKKGSLVPWNRRCGM